MESQLIAELRTMVRGRVAAGEPMAKHTSFRLGGPVEIYVCPRHEEEFVRVVRFARERGIPHFILGLGSNLLVGDGGLEGMVISTGGLRGEQWGDGAVRLGAGVALGAAANRAVARGLAGLEFAANIPGTAGGGLMMNAGAHGGELKDVLTWARVLLPGGMVEKVAPDRLELAYRRSGIKRRGWIVLEAEFSLAPAVRTQLQAQLETLRGRRRQTQPDGRTAGSVFKNPTGMAAGRLIESVGGKGLTVGKAEVSSLHANFIVAHEGARAEDVLRLMETVRKLVWEKTGVALEPEVEFWGARGETSRLAE